MGKTYDAIGSTVRNGIYKSYKNNDGCNRFGFPKSDEMVTGRLEGWVQYFDKANIYWSKNDTKSQPGIVEGSIRDKYEEMGGTNGYLGFPEGEQWNEVSACGGLSGFIQAMDYGRIYTSLLGTFDLPDDDLSKYYINEKGGVAGELGWPVSNNLWNGFQNYREFQKEK